METSYIRIYLKFLAVLALTISFVLAPQEDKQEVPEAVQAPVVTKEVPKVEAKAIAKASTPKPVVKPKPAKQKASSGGSIEGIVRQAARKHGISENYFVKIAKCESTFNPKAVNYNYYETDKKGSKYYPSGLFQHVSRYWSARAEKYGYAGASVFDAVANANVTAAMFADGLTHLWECK